ncbi:SET domain-containing protein [Geosmithia morbida]|uniref:SET domain-containing protein n=1 Tax=Geosmithia morbida TaxID=1094350 RepID=A0A9P4YXR2_9HYPO|nr:SET domain-containing protein [Geosmithia morbida]KAF4124800.1 SET domain-containing protein [Geosmithia morbida]
MDSISRLLDWASTQGIVLNGMTPKELPGCGIGLVSTRAIKPKETILSVPSSALRTLENTPKPIVDALPGATVHAILAASLAVDLANPPSDDFRIWRDVSPTPRDMTTSMPICWDASLQALLPKKARTILDKQIAKFERDWAAVSAASASKVEPISNLTREAYLYAWLLVNTRTFYHTTPTTKKKLPREDHMALQPVADLFNHSPDGCAVSFTSAGFTITAGADIPADTEVFIQYGSHSNDFLLVEYGFTLPHGLNSFDEVCLDEYLCPRVASPSKRRMLEDRGFWAGYMLDSETVCYRTHVALRALCLPEDEWIDFVDGRRDEDLDQHLVDRELLRILRRYAADIADTREKVNDVSVGDVMRNRLRERWEQIADLVDAAISRASGRIGNHV